MLKLVVFSALLALCYAQQPPRPVISETFTAHIMIHMKRGPNENTGEGTWVRSEMMGDVMRNENFRGSDEEFERLLFFNDHLEYAVFNKKCEKHDLPENVSFPMEWDWVKTAEWKSVVDPRTNKTMDSWTGHVRDVVATLYVGQGNPNMPMGLVWRGEHGEEDTRFMSFNTDEPSPAAFEVPEVCKMASTSGPRKPKGL